MPAKRQSAALLFGIGVLSAALIGLELSLSNVFAVLLQYHYVSVIISLAIFGIGIGALFSYRWRNKDRTERNRGQVSVALFARLCLLIGAIVAAMSLFITFFPYSNQLILYALLAGIPFILFGCALGIVFHELRGKVAYAYAADLGGAGLGVLFAIAAMNIWGGLAAIQLFGLLVASTGMIVPLIAGVTYKEGRLRMMAASFAFPLLLFVIVISSNGDGWLSLNLTGLKGAPPDKTLVGVLKWDAKSSIEYTKWDAFARTDVVKTSDASRKMLFVDGGAGSYMYRFNGDISSVAGLMEDIEFLPFAISPVRNAVIVGAGGGRDVLYAMLAGANDVTAVEVSSGIVDSMRQFADFNGNLADRDDVSYVVGEGRHVIETSGVKYDAIVLDLVYSQVGGARNQVLSENFVFTEEAFGQYLNHLNPGGRIIIIAHHGLEGIRAFFTGFQAVMDTYGLPAASASKHTALLLAPQESKAPDLSVAVISKDALSQSELQILQAGSMAHGLTQLFVPGASEILLKPLLEGQLSFEQFVRDSDYNVFPISDDRPFFFNIEKTFPPAYKQWLIVNLLLTVFTVIAIWLSGISRNMASGSGISGRKLIYFALLGVGYMCIQMPAIQKSMLLFGSPVLAMAVILFALLLGGGVGSLLAGKINVRSRAVWIGIAIVLTCFIFVVYSMLPALNGLQQLLRIVLMGSLVFILGVGLGIPIPLGLRRSEQDQPGSSAFYFAVNGIASLWGSWAAVALSFSGGFISTLILGLVCYVAVAVLGWRVKT